MGIIGKSEEERQEEQLEAEREAQLQSSAMQGLEPMQAGDPGVILDKLSEADLPIDGDHPVMGQIASRVTSTTNLTEDQAVHHKWMLQYQMLLMMGATPPQKGINGSWRGYAHADSSEERPALNYEDRSEVETFIDVVAPMLLQRSVDAKVMEEATRNIQESVLRKDDAEKGGGLSGMLS